MRVPHAPKRISLKWTTLRSQHGLNRLLCLGDHRHHRHKKKVGCGVGDGAHAHRKNPEAHCEGACTRICCRGQSGQVTPIPSSTITFDVVRWPHVTWVGMLFDLILRRLPFGRIHSVEPRPTSDGTSSARCTLVLMELGYWAIFMSVGVAVGHSTDLSRISNVNSAPV